MASTKEMQNQSPEEDKTDMAIKGWRPFDSTEDDSTEQYLIEYGSEKAPIHRLVSSANIPQELLEGYVDPAEEDISDPGNSYSHLTMQNLGAVMGIAWSAGSGRGEPDDINPKKSGVQLENIFILVRWMIEGTKTKEGTIKRKWESAASIDKLWQYPKDLQTCLYLWAQEAESKYELENHGEP